jgi:hypothetical protein
MIVDFEHQITELQSKLKELSETSELKRIIFKLLTTTDYQVPSIISLKKVIILFHYLLDTRNLP